MPGMTGQLFQHRERAARIRDRAETQQEAQQRALGDRAGGEDAFMR